VLLEEPAQPEAPEDSPGALPGTWLYGLKRLFERVRLLFTRDVRARAAYLAHLVELRSAEISELMRRGRTKLVGWVAVEQGKLLGEARRVLGGLKLEEATAAIFEIVEDAASNAWSVLGNAVERLPEEARKTVAELRQRLHDEARGFWQRVLDLIHPPGQGNAQGKLKRFLDRLKKGI
jgi:hypothetical protein